MDHSLPTAVGVKAPAVSASTWSTGFWAVSPRFSQTPCRRGQTVTFEFAASGWAIQCVSVRLINAMGRSALIFPLTRRRQHFEEWDDVSGSTEGVRTGINSDRY